MEPWMTDALVQSIPKEKMEFLSKLFQQGKGKSQKEMMANLLPLLKEGKEKGLSFTPAEISAAIAAVRKHSSQEENQKIDELLKRMHPAK